MSSVLVKDCAEYHFRSLVSKDFQSGGVYYVDPKGDQTRQTSLHHEAADDVWNHTLDVLKLHIEW